MQRPDLICELKIRSDLLYNSALELAAKKSVLWTHCNTNSSELFFIGFWDKAAVKGQFWTHIERFANKHVFLHIYPHLCSIAPLKKTFYFILQMGKALAGAVLKRPCSEKKIKTKHISFAWNVSIIQKIKTMNCDKKQIYSSKSVKYVTSQGLLASGVLYKIWSDKCVGDC